MAERSPFAQGLRWEPSRSGDGFAIWNMAEHDGVIWFTYDNAGRPIWYSLQVRSLASARTRGTCSSIDGATAHPAAPVVASSLRLSVNHAESVDITWELAGTREPFWRLGSTTTIIGDHTDHWVT